MVKRTVAAAAVASIHKLHLARIREMQRGGIESPRVILDGVLN